MSNRLAEETSPYLRQHAHNPVDWYPWGEEALERSKREDKPILLSVGYSACHWCHVMERESFEDDATARLMNELFVNIKVDREERPDIDAIYMQALQAMNGHGGWPMTVFLTPQLEPFWAGTYFPPVDGPGMPCFQRVLRAVADAFQQRREDVQRVAASMRDMYAANERVRGSGALSADLLGRAARGLLGAHDNALGGFGEAPKFPHAMAMEFLLQRWAREHNDAARDAVRFTFLRMARGGIYDQVGGGFARYSVDAHWLVPHFEKMLYDNALLLRLGVHLWQATGDADVRQVCEDTIGWLQREMQAPAGGYYSALDADSEGEEGKFYVWSVEELRDVLGGDADALLAYWGATVAGNFEGQNILHVANTAVAMDAETLRRGRDKLLAARARRVRPGRDDKILASWNGLAVRALAEAGRAFDDARLRDIAVRNGTFLFRELVHERGTRVFRTHMAGASRTAGFLEDHAAVALAALSLYECTFERVWLDRARTLADAIARRFWDDETNAFYDTASDHERLITRPRDITDNATPSGTSLAVELLLRLGDLLGESDMTRRATHVLETIAEPMARYPLAFGHALTAADLPVHGAIELAIVGDPGDARFAALSRAVASRYAPSLVTAGGMAADDVALLRDRNLREGVATAYLCRGYVCDEPVTDPQRLAEQMERAASGR